MPVLGPFPSAHFPGSQRSWPGQSSCSMDTVLERLTVRGSSATGVGMLGGEQEET